MSIAIRTILIVNLKLCKYVHFYFITMFFDKLNVLQKADLQDFEDICVRNGLKKVEHLEHVTLDLQQELGIVEYAFTAVFNI